MGNGAAKQHLCGGDTRFGRPTREAGDAAGRTQAAVKPALSSKETEWTDGESAGGDMLDQMCRGTIHKR